MSKKKLSPRKLQTVLIGDELLDANLANLVPASSKIGDSAATFIDKAWKLVELRDLLNKTFPETTKNEIAEPTDLGLYITADGQQILLLDEDGDWRAVDDNFQPIRGFWGDSTFESDWTTVCEKLGDAATTLTKVTASDINVTTVRVIQ